MLTTRDLKLRQAEVLKNIDETYRQIKRQPVGGLGALIQKSNNPPQKIPFVPTIFTPAPMTSSLPYLADWVKMRSNETILQLSADIARRNEVAKASFYIDAMKTAEYQQKLDDNMVIRNQVEPSGKDLMMRFLAGEIQNRKREEYVIETLRRNREDMALNPVIPVTPVARAAGAIEAGDLGARAYEPTPLERLATSARERVFPNLKDVADQLLTKRLNDALPEFPTSRLKDIYKKIKEEVTYQLPEKQLQSRPELITQIVKAKRLGYNVPLEGLPELRSRSAAEGGGAAPAAWVGGGSVGGGGLAAALKGSLD